MKRIMVRYKVKTDRASENERPGGGTPRSGSTMA